MGRRQVTIERRPAAAGRPPVEVQRSTGRRRTASAYARDGAVVVQLPAGMPAADEEQVVATLVDRVSGALRAREAGGDAELARRADVLADTYLDGVRARSARWSARMGRRHGSCTPADGTIRISRRAAAYPQYVLEYILVHELAHLQVRGHSAAFWELVARYPQAERARGFLEGIDHNAVYDPGE
ncbi:MAG: M48 family metallopeptidase [Actinomycetota bacterium]|nr:M48 family metallopeptidase [Actinomycetota bacterium]